MGLKVYVAGGSSERAEVAKWIARVREFAEVTHDWTDDPGFGGGCGEVFRTATSGGAWRCGDVSHDHPVLCPACLDPRRIAETDRAAVAAADVVWCLLPREKSEGAAWELGYGHGLGKVTIVSPSDRGRVPHPFVTLTRDFASHKEAFAWLKEHGEDVVGSRVARHPLGCGARLAAPGASCGDGMFCRACRDALDPTKHEQTR